MDREPTEQSREASQPITIDEALVIATEALDEIADELLSVDVITWEECQR
jgi:hypothetical protein